MEYQVGDTLKVDGGIYHVTGKILYKNTVDNCSWFEYKIVPDQYGDEKWLSYDATYREYSISEVAWNISTAGYHEVDRGVEVVKGAWGDVDVEIDDKASFVEYEDDTEELIISLENWEDGQETSKGYYLDEDEVEFLGAGRNGGYGDNLQNRTHTTTYSDMRGRSTRSYNSKKFSVAGILIFLMMFLSPIASVLGASSGTTIAKHLKKSINYTYVTSITGSTKKNADVYQSSLSLDATAKDIIDAIKGNTVDVQQNTEDGDNSIALLTKKEYCYIYTAEDGTIYVQISSREYAYNNDSEPYRSTDRSSRYYRRYYYSRGYSSDSSSYSGYSPYSSYSGDTISSSSGDTYRSYSSSVRQASTSSRTSSGGGISSGK